MTDQAGPPGQLDDLITIWHSELAALAADREVHEALQRLAALWAAQASVIARLCSGPADAASGRAGPAAPPRAAAAADAPDSRDGVIERLLERVAELERRLAGLERA